MALDSLYNVAASCGSCSISYIKVHTISRVYILHFNQSSLLRGSTDQKNTDNLIQKNHSIMARYTSRFSKSSKLYANHSFLLNYIFSPNLNLSLYRSKKNKRPHITVLPNTMRRVSSRSIVLGSSNYSADNNLKRCSSSSSATGVSSYTKYDGLKSPKLYPASPTSIYAQLQRAPTPKLDSNQDTAKKLDSQPEENHTKPPPKSFVRWIISLWKAYTRFLRHRFRGKKAALPSGFQFVDVGPKPSLPTSNVMAKRDGQYWGAGDKRWTWGNIEAHVQSLNSSA